MARYNKEGIGYKEKKNKPDELGPNLSHIFYLSGGPSEKTSSVGLRGHCDAH